MPSTLVHVAVGGLVGAALLGERFSPRAIAVVLVAAAVPDLDSFLVFAWAGAHRTVLHTLVLPTLLGVGLYWDRRVGDRLGRWLGADGHYVAAVAVVALLAGGILPDLMTNGVNAVWPVHNQFYTVDGKLVLSNQRGVVQTFVDLTPDEPAASTKNRRYSTGVDPKPYANEQGPVERTFPLVTAGWQLMLVVLSGAVVGVRTWQTRPADAAEPAASDTVNTGE